MTSRRATPRLLVAHALASVATGLPWPVLLVLVDERTSGGPHAGLLLGLAGAARMLPYVMLSWAVGSLGDRVRRDRLIRVTLALRLLGLGTVAVAISGGQVLVAVVVASLAVACGTPAYPALAAALPALAGDGRRRATETLVTIEVGSWVVGPALGGLLLLAGPRALAPATATALLAAALLTLSGLRLPGPVGREGGPGVAAMLGAVGRAPEVAGAMVLAGLLNLVLAATAITLLPLAREAWGRGDAGFGIATACLGFGALGAPLLWWWRGTPRSRCLTGLLVVGALVALVAVVPVHLSWSLLALVGACAVCVEGAATQTIQDGVADEHRAGALGLADAVMVGAALTGTLVAPALATQLAPRLMLVAVAGGCWIGAAAWLGWVRPVRVPAASEPAPSPRGADRTRPDRGSATVNRAGAAGRRG